jgi:ADP-ribose pyrophosphatase YjhB (NUDIX family)
MPLRLGVDCAVIDDAGQVLLSKRGDFNIWNLPGGRVDSGEALSDAAAREVREETGVVAHIERAVTLYYMAGWGRMNVLFAGWPLGGELRQRSFETRANQFFMPSALPKMFGAEQVRDAVSEVRPPPHIIESSAAERRRVKRRLGWRWIKNLVNGHPEPRFPLFHIRAVGLIWDQSHRRVLTLPGKRSRVLPRVHCEGGGAPWDELGQMVYHVCRVSPNFLWAGLWQDVPRNHLEFVFAATLPENNLLGGAEWSGLQNAALGDRDLAYTERVKSSYATDPVWTILHHDEAGHGLVLQSSL